MADNVTNPATVTIATNDVSSVHYQKYKLIDGTPGGTAGIVGTAANGLYVDARSSGTAVNTQVVDISDGALHTLLALNTARRRVSIQNMSAAQFLYVLCAAGATLANAGAVIPPLSYYELPFNYTGIITGLLDGADAGATARIQEF